MCKVLTETAFFYQQCHEWNESHEFPSSFRVIWALVRFLILFALFFYGESGALRGHKNAKLLLKKYLG